MKIHVPRLDTAIFFPKWLQIIFGDQGHIIVRAEDSAVVIGHAITILAKQSTLMVFRGRRIELLSHGRRPFRRMHHQCANGLRPAFRHSGKNFSCKMPGGGGRCACIAKDVEVAQCWIAKSCENA